MRGPRFGGGRRRAGRGHNPFILMMMLQLLSRLVQSGWTPPVTLGLFILNSAIHFVPNLGLPPLLDVCMQPTMVLFHGDLARVLLSPFYHATDTHIYFNMASLVYKGMRLEKHFGSERFLVMVVSVLFMSQAIYLGLAVAMAVLLGLPSTMQGCAVGFSGVLFALKVVLSFQLPPHMQSMWGIPIHSRYAAWLELVLIQFIAPQASWVGHLAGILAGLAWVFVPRLLRKYKLVGPTTWVGGAGTGAHMRDGVLHRPNAAQRPTQHYSQAQARPQPPPQQQRQFVPTGYRDPSGQPPEHVGAHPSGPASARTHGPHMSAQQMREARLRHFG